MKIEREFSTAEAAVISGATLRQLQVWDERGPIRPKHGNAGKRIYSALDVFSACVIMELKRYGMTLKGIRNAIKPIRDVPNGGYLVVHPVMWKKFTSRFHRTVKMRAWSGAAYVCTNQQSAWALLLAHNSPSIVLSLKEIASKVR